METAYPGTTPPQLKRRPFDLSGLPPQMQQAIMTNGQLTLDDGSVIYADGTATGAGDSPDDYDLGPGGFNGSPQFGGPAALGGGGYPGVAPAAPTDPFASAQFDRYFGVANAGFPGQPGGIGGGPAPAEGPAAMNPMGDPMGDPFAVEAQQRPGVQLTVEAPRVGAYGAGETGDARVGSGQGKYGGRLGRRMASGQRKPGGGPLNSRRR